MGSTKTCSTRCAGAGKTENFERFGRHVWLGR
jgi:hypothetical protein